MQSNLIKVNTQVQSSRVYENTILSDNPIHYWRFEETSGRTAQATVGSRDGTYWGGYTLGEISAYTNLGNAVRLDGFNNTHIALGTPIHPGNSISVEAWFNLDPSSINTFSPIIARWDGSYELDINNSTNPSLGQGKANMVVSSTTGTPGFAVSNNPVSKGEWHHIVGVFEGVSDGGSGGITIFVDGIQGTTTTIGGNLEDLGGDDGLWYIGRTRSPNSGFAWDGLLDEVAIYTNLVSSPLAGSKSPAATLGCGRASATGWRPGTSRCHWHKNWGRAVRSSSGSGLVERNHGSSAVVLKLWRQCRSPLARPQTGAQDRATRAVKRWDGDAASVPRNG